MPCSLAPPCLLWVQALQGEYARLADIKALRVCPGLLETCDRVCSYDQNHPAHSAVLIIIICRPIHIHSTTLTLPNLTYFVLTPCPGAWSVTAAPPATVCAAERHHACQPRHAAVTRGLCSCELPAGKPLALQSQHSCIRHERSHHITTGVTGPPSLGYWC